MKADVKRYFNSPAGKALLERARRPWKAPPAPTVPAPTVPAPKLPELSEKEKQVAEKYGEIWENTCIAIAERSGGSWQREFSGIRVTITRQDA